jgi:hypothetical protein
MTETVAPWDVGRPTPQPSQSVASVAAPQQSDAGPRALAAQGQALTETAAEVDRFGLHIETLQAQDALNQLRARKDDLTYGQQGFMQVKGGDVIKKDRPGGPLLDDYSTKFRAVSDDLAKNLGPRGRMMYNQRAAAELTGFKSDIAKHSIQQTEFYQVAVDKDTQQQALAQAARFADDPAKLSEQAERAGTAAERLAISQGRPFEGAGLAARSNVYRVGVETLMGNGANRQALTYFDAVKDKLDGPDRVALASKLQGVQTGLRGEQAANEAITKVGGPPILSQDSSPGGPRENNIGNVRPVGSSTGFQAFPTFDDGVAGTVKNLRAYPGAFNGGKPMTLLQIGERWAPKGDGANDPAQWARNVSATAGVPVDQPIDMADPKVMAKVARGVHAAEWGGNRLRPAEDYQSGTNAAFGGPRMPTTSSSTATVFKGDVNAAYQAAAQQVVARTDLTTPEKTQALTLLTQQRTQMEGLRTATVKSLDDYAQTETTKAMLDPGNYKDGTLLDIAQRYEAVGEGAKATRYRVLAAMEAPLKTFATTTSDGQRAQINALTEGVAHQVGEGVIAGDAKSRAEAKVRASELFARAQQGFKNSVDPEGLVPILKEASSLYATAGDVEGARKVGEFYESAASAHGANQQPPPAAQQTIADLKAAADRGKANGQMLQTLDFMNEVHNRQQADLNKDPLAAGARIYKSVGPLSPLDPTNLPGSLAARANTARQIEALSGHKTPLLTNEEATMTRNRLNEGTPQQQQAILQSFATAPSDAIPGIGAMLAGKDDVSDPVSRGYAAALSFNADGSPDIAATILDGVNKRKTMGDALRNMPKSDAFFEAVQTKVGNAFKSLDGKVPAIVVNAAEAIYTSKMIAAGRQGEKALDDTVFNQALDAVVGKTIARNGQTLVPPKGVDSYQFDSALRQMENDNIIGLRTLNGSPVTADKIARYGMLSNAGKDGLYFVEMPDPARGGAPAYVQGPDGKPFTIDIKTLIEQAKRNPDLARTRTGMPVQGTTFLPGVIPERRSDALPLSGSEEPVVVERTNTPSPTERLRGLVRSSPGTPRIDVAGSPGGGEGQ